MDKDKKIMRIFQALSILTPVLMLVTQMAEKNFNSIALQASIVGVYFLIGAYVIGYMHGSANDNSKLNKQ